MQGESLLLWVAFFLNFLWEIFKVMTYDKEANEARHIESELTANVDCCRELGQNIYFKIGSLRKGDRMSSRKTIKYDVVRYCFDLVVYVNCITSIVINSFSKNVHVMSTSCAPIYLNNVDYLALINVKNLDYLRVNDAT